MRTSMFLKEKSTDQRFFGTRFSARALREELDLLLANGNEVVLDFAGVEATQSFIDELIGYLILRHGHDLLPRLIFKSCSDELKTIIQFVISDRLDQFNRLHRH
jgi:hypothetical protein